MQSTVKPKKQRVRGARKSALTSSAVYSVWVVFALSTIVAHPSEMKTSAVKSYYQMNFSPRMLVDKIIAATIELAEFAARRVKSRNCSR